MSNVHLQAESSAGSSSLEDYDKFFDTHNTFEDLQKAASSHKLPIGEVEQEVPIPYCRDSAEIDFTEHHSAAYYPHTHQTLKNSESRRRRKKKERDASYKKRKGSRPSQLFHPSLQEVAEQESEHFVGQDAEEREPFDTDVGAEAKHEGQPLSSEASSGRYRGSEYATRLQDAVAPEHRSTPSPLELAAEGSEQSDSSLRQRSGTPVGGAAANVKFIVGDQSDHDSLDGRPLMAIPRHLAPRRSVNKSAPSQLAASGSSSAAKPVKFLIGGDGSHSTMQDQESTSPLPTVETPRDCHVTFILGAESVENIQGSDCEGATAQLVEAASEGSRRRRHSTDESPPITAFQPMKSRSYSFHPGDDLAAIRCRGSDVALADLPEAIMTRITSPDEAALLNKYDLEDLATHRFERLRGYGKHKINKRSMAKLTAAGGAEAAVTKAACDLTPHELFVELDELVTQQHDETTEFMEWKEKARWIKFEEDVLETSDRWGRPHVASLSFHSLIELRRLLESGAVLMDVDVHDYMSMMQAVVDQLVSRSLLPKDQREYVMRALILRHSHLDGKAKFTRSKSYGNLMGLDSMTRHSRSSHFFGATKNNNDDLKSKRNGEMSLNMPEEEIINPLLKRNSRSYGANLDKERYNMELLKKIPADAEVASVLVGTLKDLKKPCTTLFRLSQGVMLDHVAEVPLPIRFLFVCIGPNLESVEYLEIGRSLATLMSNKSFRDAAYGARHKDSILTAMNAFLDKSMVLPPGDFDKKTLLPIMHMAKKSLKARKEKAKLSGDCRIDGKPPFDDPLARTGRPFGGLVKDVRRKLPHYLSDMKDGMNAQVFAAFIFIYFACLSPAITFGGLLGEKTDNYMGASEMLMATSISGVTFSLLGGQPLLITGFTGPNMVFEEGVYKFSKTFELDFLTWRLWIGVWVFIISLVLVATEASFLVKFVSRFTQEIFAFLISLIFLYEVLNKLIKVFTEHPLCEDYSQCLAEAMNTSRASTHVIDSLLSRNITKVLSGNILPVLTVDVTTVSSEHVTTAWFTDVATSGATNTTAKPPIIMQPNTALLTMALTLFTFVLAYALKGLRNKKLLGRTIRRALGDFGVPLSIIIMCLIDFILGDRVYTQKLAVPPKFSVTAPEKRGWFVNPLGGTGPDAKPFPVGHIFSAALPAILASILIFMESLIAGMIVDKKENKLRKGSGFHLDMLVLGFIALVCGFLGVPFVCAATVRSVAHMSALTVMSRNHAPGERAKLERIIEQRLSNLLVHILIAISMFLGVVLQYIPIAVLFGVFLYMGIASLSGIQLFDRIILLLTPTKHHPVDVGYVRHVRARKMHLFTIIEVLCVGVLWTVKLSPGALAFPFVLLLLVPLRKFLLPFLFTPQELGELDTDEDCRVLDGVDDEDPDFYETAHMPD